MFICYSTNHPRQFTIPEVGVVESGDSFVVDDFEEFELVQSLSFLVGLALTGESADFAHELPVRVPVNHFPDDACSAPVETKDQWANSLSLLVCYLIK